MNDPPKIIRDPQAFTREYQSLKRNDIICGAIRLKPGEEHLLADLLARGVQCIPSATAQLASRSKVFQARIFRNFMLPGTIAIYDNHDLLEAASLYNKEQVTKVILKCDRKNAGMGIHIFNSIEDLYNHVCSGGFPPPFVIQPYQPEYRDIRVIILGDFVEAYERVNQYNFRNNLHCGGNSTPCMLPKEQLSFCKDVMQRAAFTCAHVDLMITPEGGCWLTEINLNGGLRGAQINRVEYKERTEKNNEQELAQLLMAS